MATVRSTGAFRQELNVADAPGGVTIQVTGLPEGVYDITLYCIGVGGASAAIVEETYDNAAAVQADTAVWSQVDASLAAVGTTGVRYLMPHTPVFLRLRQLTATRTARLVIAGKIGG